MSPFTKIYYIGVYQLTMCYIYHCLFRICDAYELTSSASNFIFALVMKVWVKAISVCEQVIAI